MIDSVRKLTIRAEGTKVLITMNDHTFWEMDWRKADELAALLRGQARRCEELEQAEQVAKDSALLLRAGAPFGLTDHPLIKDEARKIAAWDPQLRRALPGGIKSEAQLGTPSIIKHPPKH